jgi:hypothetical protein
MTATQSAIVTGKRAERAFPVHCDSCHRPCERYLCVAVAGTAVALCVGCIRSALLSDEPRNVGGRPRVMTAERERKAAALMAESVPLAEMARRLRVSRASIARWVRSQSAGI